MTYDTHSIADMIACARTAVGLALTAIERDSNATLSITHRQQIAGLLRDLRALRRLDRQHFATWQAREQERRRAA